jgi:hypothetical protein
MPGESRWGHTPVSRYPPLYHRTDPPMPHEEVQLTCGHTNAFDLPPEPGKSVFCRRCEAYVRVAA